MNHNKKLTPLAQELRKNMTREERKLWYDYLSQYPYRFRRQVSCGNYILDFYCATAKLAVELDGSQHYTPEGQRYDCERNRFFEKNGILVLHVSNADIQRNLRGVCDHIDRTVKQRVE